MGICPMLLSTVLSLQRLNEAFFPQEQGKLQTPFFAPLRGTPPRPAKSFVDARSLCHARPFPRRPFLSRAAPLSPHPSGYACSAPPTRLPEVPREITCCN